MKDEHTKNKPNNLVFIFFFTDKKEASFFTHFEELLKVNDFGYTSYNGWGMYVCMYLARLCFTSNYTLKIIHSFNLANTIINAIFVKSLTHVIC